MLPNIAPHHADSANSRSAIPRVAADKLDALGRCVWVEEISWISQDHAPAAGYQCQLCPLVEDCLRNALAVDADYMAGLDSYGLVGVYGGVWFDQAAQPISATLLNPRQRLPHRPRLPGGARQPQHAA